ncbi:peptide synthetase [Cordyceps fumosorosea ARSEF 2679]|uniref:Peptide synthetase n=1 Tax=Cordyceps fumosorosea (strain ARSEF 2679) TaxID=1081104 RepID=A0A168CJ07_CORFA|nr:peptide synthetase [Cordyceps fumosorosea ARSEF 2679]OAA71437.1 peptide synthetase [Cordyceps fumosorosea ARSEF 2679]
MAITKEAYLGPTTPECVGDGRMLLTLSLKIRPEATYSLPKALQLAWYAVLGAYTGSKNVSFDLLQLDDETVIAGQAAVGSTVKVSLARHDTVLVAMDKMSQLESYTGGEPSDTLIALSEAEALAPRSQTYAQYHLAVEALMMEELVHLRAVYDASVWSSETIHFTLHQIHHAMDVMAESLSVPVSALQEIGVESQRQLMDWDRAQPWRPSLETVWPAVEKCCKNHPHKMAIESWDGRITYGELEQRVSAVAYKLAQLGLQPGAFVGLLLDKSAMATIAILGVIKAGYAFVLLDSSQPTQRLKTMCSITAVATIVATPRNAEAASKLGIAYHSTESFSMSAPSNSMLHTQPQAGSPLYAGFTSGSTGEPKGFLIQHGNFMSGLDEYCSSLNLELESRVFQFASYSFVVSITGQLAPLTRGACLCVPSQSQLEHDLAGAIRDLGANWLAITPSAARILDPAEAPSLETVVMVGEEMSPSDLAKWSHLNLYSLYGQSENSKGTMIGAKAGRHATNGIGIPFYANAWIVHHEDHDILLPIGAEGELVIESPCLTKGYINNTAQTEASFITNPKWVKSIGRKDSVCIFKTGDLARRNAADGSFQLLGRKGTRVKIRGQRVELGEVEHHIRRLLPGARSVAVDIVCAAEDALEESPILVAFVLMRAGPGDSKGAHLLAAPTLTFQKQSMMLQSLLKEVLPSFMVPTTYVELAVLPKTSTGKLDRRRMREAAAAMSRRDLIGFSATRATYREPGTEEETAIRDLCEQVLQLSRGEVGMDDTFVDLGGDSLMARHLITRAKSKGLSISLQELFQPETLAQITQNTRDRTEHEAPQQLSSPEAFTALRQDFMGNLPEALCKDDVEDVLPTLQTQAAYASSRVVDCFPLHISGSVDAVRLRGACQALIARHPILRTVFHLLQENLVQVVLREVHAPWSEHKCDSWTAAVHWVEELWTQELKKRYDIGKPIIGFSLVTVEADARHILVMRLCHGQYDALCLRPLIKDMWAAYQGATLAIKPEFRMHVEECYQRRTAQAYNIWRGILKGSQPNLLFPQAPAADDEATLSLTTLQLPEIRPLAGVTAASMVKAAWYEALWHETRQEDLVFGQFLHVWSGADDDDGGGVVGPCMNVIPVRVRPSQGRTRRQTLQAIQAQHAETASPADALGWRDIVANCTDWPAATGADSVVLHQNFDRDIEVIADGIVCKKETPMLSHWAVFPLLLVTHPRKGRLDALLLMSSRYRGLCDPVTMLNNFAKALELLESHADEAVNGEAL